MVYNIPFHDFPIWNLMPLTPSPPPHTHYPTSDRLSRSALISYSATPPSISGVKQGWRRSVSWYQKAQTGWHLQKDASDLLYPWASMATATRLGPWGWSSELGTTSMVSRVSQFAAHPKISTKFTNFHLRNKAFRPQSLHGYFCPYRYVRHLLARSMIP